MKTLQNNFITIEQSKKLLELKMPILSADELIDKYGSWTATITLDPIILDLITLEMEQFRPEFVDLGLSVKWAKYNLGAKPGRYAKDWYGAYYAWGETKSKFEFRKNNYNKPIINNNRLAPDNDTATVNCGKPWRMPTKDEFNELRTLPNEWVTNYNGISGLNGRVFTGINGNTLFIPAAGYCNDSNINEVGLYCHMWSSDLGLYYRFSAFCFCFHPDTPYGNTYMSSGLRSDGYNVRPVC